MLTWVRRYPYVATEILCSEIWSIVETCFNNTEQLMVPFWETVLDRSAEDMKTEMVMATHFAKINAVFLTKKPAEVCTLFSSSFNITEPSLKCLGFALPLSGVFVDARVYLVTAVSRGKTATTHRNTSLLGPPLAHHPA